MAFARVALFPGATEEHVDKLVAELGEAHRDPAGRMVFVRGPVPEGYQIVHVWRSRDDLERWVTDYLNPAIARLGGDVFPHPPHVSNVELDEILLGRGVAAEGAVPK